MIAAFSKDELIHEVLVAPREKIIPLADTRIIERPGWWQIVTPSFKQGGMNEVICTDVRDADAILDETVELYRKLGLQFRFTVGPSAQPDDLAERLARRGLHRSEALGMARSTQDVGTETSAGVSVEPVGMANLDDFTQVMAAGWQQTNVAPLYDLHRQMLTDPGGRHHLFLARKDGVAAAAASSVSLERSAYLIGAVTHPAWRGMGLYRALVNARLRHAASRGLALATTLARADTSAPILKRLGFETVFSVPVFRNS